MWIARGRRLALLASICTCLLAPPLAAQPQLASLQPADGALLAARTGTLTGRAEGAVLLRVDGHELALGGDGSFSYAFDLPEGESALSIYAEDAEGLATSQVHHLEVDTLAPGIVVSAPAQTRVAASPVDVAGTVQDPHLSGVTVRGSPASLSGNAFSASVSLAEGAQNVAIVATDSLGRSSTVTLVLTLDTGAPTISVTEAGVAYTGGLFKRPVTPVVAITDAGSFTSEILLDGSPYTSGTAIASEGAHQLEITATDGVGNSASREIDFTLDFTAPVFGTISPAAGALVASGTVSLQVEATGATSVKVGSQQGSASGNVWSIGPITLAEGAQELTIEAFDAAGNRAERHHALIRDTTAPTLVIVAPAQNAVLTTSPATISGTAGDPRLASVKVNGNLASLSGSSFSLSQALAEGANAFEVVALDSAGNSSSQTLNLTLDTTAPSFTVKVGGVALAGGEVFSSAITPTIELSEPSATVVATLDGASFTFGAAISADGNHQLSVTVTHNSLSSSNLFNFRIDRQAPIFGALLPAEGTVLAATTVLLEGSVSGAASLTVDGAAVSLDGGAFTAGPYTLTAGASRTFVLLARSAGGLTTERRLTLVQDATAPQLAIQQPAEGALLGAATVSVSGTATDPHLLRVRVSGVDAQVSASSWLASNISLAEGSNTLTVVAEDRAGNQRTLTRTVVRDSTDPEIAITEPAAGTVVPAASYTIRGTATDAHLDRVEVGSRRATLAGSNFSLEVTLAAGANTFEAVAIDKLGRRKTASVSITRDSEAPQVLIVEPPEGFATKAASITVRGAYENETGTTVKINGINAVLTTGHFEAAAVPLAPGENRITARAVDVQGNAGVHTRVVVRDEVAPNFVRLEPAAGALALPLSTVFRVTFSEDMATPAEGAITLATLAGSPIGFTAAVQGDDLVITPQAPLPPQTTLRLTLTAALTDRAGNALSPVPAPFELTTVDTGAPGAPVLTATPVATACRTSVQLAGSAEADAQIKVTGGAAAAFARADESGAFAVEVELLAEQTSVLHLTATDALGNVSPELVLSLGADCTPPQVADAQLSGAAITVTFSEPITALSTAFRLASPSGTEAFTFALSGGTATLTLAAPPAGLLELAVGQPGATAGASTVTDLAGNTLAFPWRRLFGAGGGDSFLAGTVFDDGRGQPLEGVIVSVTTTNGVELADPLPQVTTSADGRFLLGLPVGTHDVTFARPGYSPVFRVVTTAAGQGTHVFDPRLTLLSLPKPIGAAGGELISEGARFEVPSGAFATSQATSLTVLSEQALPSLLPYGFSPRGAVYLNFGASLSSPGTLTLPVETANGREVVIASLDFALLQWKALAVETVSGGTLEIAITQPGAYVVIEADAESASLLEAVIGQVLPSLPAPEGDEIEAAEVDFSPTQVLPSQRSRATVSYTLADAGTPAPSGLPLTLGVQERLTLLDGSERRAVPYSADLLVFRAPNGDPRSRFWLQPSPLAASLPIEIGAEDVTVRTFGETTVRGNILGPDGGSVLGTDGDLLEIPAGALTKPTAVVVRRRTVGDLSHAAPAGFPVLGVIEVDLGGAQLAGIGRLTLATEDPPASGARGLLLGTEEIDGEPRWRALSELEPVSEGWRTVASGGSNPPWPGIREGGLYLAIELEGDWGLLEGELFDTDQELVAGGLISSAAVEWIQLSNANGTYVIPLPAGDAVVVSARDTRHDQVSVEIPALTNLERRVFDLEVLATGPTVIEIEPADGAANVPTTFLPEVRFSESIDRASLEEGIRLTRGGEPVAIDVDHQDDRVTLDPVASLLPDTTYTLEVGTEIADLQGRHLVAMRSVSFRTQASSAPTPGIDPAKLRLYEPDFEGLARIVGLPGAVPADSTIWVESVETITVVAAANGSFELEIPASLGDDLFLTVLVPGQSAAVRLLGPWLIRGDLGAYVGPQGGTFQTAAGVEVEVQRDSFESLTRVALQLQAPPISTPSQLQVLLDFDLDLGGQDSLKPIFVRLPAPASVPANTTFLLSRYVEGLGRRGWMAMDLLRKDGSALTNADFENVQGSIAARAAGVDASRYENPLERVLSAENMEALRQGAYLPRASLALPREPELAPRQALEAAPQKTEAQDIGLPALKTGGHYQVASTVVDVAWFALTRGVGDLMMFAMAGDSSLFLALTHFAGPRSLLVPIFGWLHPVEVAVYDLTTGYEVYRQVQPPTQEPFIRLPPGASGDNQPPSVVEGSPLRFVLIQTSIPGTLEVLPGITATIGANSLQVQGDEGSTGSDTEIRLFDIDAAGDSESATAPKDAKVRSTESGAFSLGVASGGRRYLLALGARIGPSEKLKLRFSEVVPSVEGIELHRVDEEGEVNENAVTLGKQSLEGGIAWQINPVSGWRAGKYQLWITEEFGDNGGAGEGETNNKWKRKFTLELEVTRSSSIASIPLTRFADFDRLGNVLAIADNDGGLRLFDVSNPADPTPLLSGPLSYRLAGGGAIRGVAIDSHGRVVIVGSGEQFSGQLHVLDPLVMDREAPEAEAWASGVWGFTTITNPLGVSYPFQKSGLPRRVAVMNNDRTDRWQAGAAAPAGIAVEVSPIPDSDEQDLEITGEEAGEHSPVSLRNLTRGRWNRVFADEDGAFTVPIKARAGDLLELRRGQGTWAYASIDNRGIAMVDVDGSRGGALSDAASLALVRYTGGYELDSSNCGDRPDVDSTPTSLKVVLGESPSGAQTATLVTLVQGYGLALYQINTTNPRQLNKLSSACAAVENQVLIAGMEVVANYPIDLDGDGRIRERDEIKPDGGIAPKEIRDYVVVAHARGHVLIFDITDPALPQLVSRIPMGKPREVVQISGVTVDRVNRRIYIGAFGRGLFAIDFNALGGIGLQDADDDELDDRVAENIQVGSEELVDTLAFPELGVIWGGGRTTGAHSVAVGGPQLKMVAADGGPIREVARLAPLGVPTAPEGGKKGNPNYPGAFQAQVTVGSAAAELEVDVTSLGPAGMPIGSAGNEEFLPAPKLEGDKAVKLERQATNPWEEGSTLYLSKPVVAIADLRAIISFQKTADEKEACVRCDQVAEHLYNAQPLPANFLPELLSGHRVSVSWKEEMLPGLRAVYGNLVGAPTSVPSVPWAISPSLQQEPAMNPSTGMGDVAPGTLLHSGEFSHDVTDFAIPGLGFDFVFTRSYRNQTLGSGPLGPGWDHNWNLSLRPLPNGEVELYDGRGRRELVFTPLQDKLPELKPLVSFQPHHQGYVVTDKEGNHFQFDTAGRLSSIADPLKGKGDDKGSEILFSYDAESRLVEVGSHGRKVVLSYSDGKLESVRDPAERQWRYHYDAAQRLIRVESPEADLGDGTAVAIETTYGYTPGSEGGVAAQLEARDDLDTIVDPLGTTILDIDYETVPGSHSTRVTKQVIAGGPGSIDFTYQDRITKVKDRRDAERVYTHDAYGHLFRFMDPLSKVTVWHPVHFEVGKRNGLVAMLDMPNGGRIEYSYDEALVQSSLRKLANLKRITRHGTPYTPETVPPGDAHAACAWPRSFLPITLMEADDIHEMTNVPGSVQGPEGQSVDIQRDEAGVVQEITVSSGAIPLRVTFESDDQGLPTETNVEESGGETSRTVKTTTKFDRAGLPTREEITVDGSPYRTSYERDDRGNVTEVTAPGNVVTRSRYNQLDWLLEECRDASGQNVCTRFHYDKAGRPVRIEKPFGTGQHVATKMEYGPRGEIEEIRSELQPGGSELVETYVYDPNLNVLEIDPPGLAKKTYVYDQGGRLESATEVLGNDEATTTTYTYNTPGQLVSLTDGQQTTEISYDSFGRRASVKDPQQNVTYFHYNKNGDVVHEATCHGDPGDHDLLSSINRRFGPGGQLLEEVVLAKGADESSESLSTVFEYDNLSRVVSVTGPDGATHARSYDPLGRVVRESTPGIESGVVETFYREEGRKIDKVFNVGNALVTSSTRLNGLGLAESHTNALAETTRFSYDGAGHLLIAEQPNGSNYFYTYDGLGRPLTVTQPEGIAETFTYVDQSDATTVTYRDALGHTTVTQYGSAGELLSVTYPDATTEIRTYDARGNALEIDLPSVKITQSFDANNQLISRVRTEGEGPAANESFSWDSLGRPASATVGGHGTSWLWDTASRLRRETQGGKSVEYAPHPTGARGGIQYPSGLEVARSYNAAGALSSVAVGPMTLATLTQKGGGLLSSQYGPLNGQFTHDAAGRLQRAEWNTTSRILEENLLRDLRGLPTHRSRADLGQQWNYSFDPAARLDTAEQKGAASALSGLLDYDYDPAQNLIRRQRTSACGASTIELPRDGSGRNRPGSVAGEDLDWDDRGRLVKKRDLLFEYDDRDRLVAVVRQFGAGSNEPVAAYTYDVEGRRVAREVGSTTVRTVWDGWQAIEDYVGETIVSQRFFGSGLDQMFLIQLPQGSGTLEPYFPVYDSLGNLSVLVRGNGKPVERYDYDPYGGRVIVANDNQPPVLEQIRLQDGEVRLQLSEPTVKDFGSSAVTLQNLSRSEQPELIVAILSTEGRQWGRQIVFRNGGDPEDDPPTWPQAGDHVRLVVAEHAFEDNFGNQSETYTYADLVWPGDDGILVDNTPPRVEEICSSGTQLKLTFSEPVSAILAAETLTIDSQPVVWISEDDGYTLSVELEPGAHDLVLSQDDLDLAGLALAEYGNQVFVTDTSIRPIFAAPFPGEVAASTVGNVYGFQGLPEDAETGFLYVRNRYYDPELGRFITSDPMGYADGPSQYQFALNNPIANGDPTGESATLIGGFVGGLAGGAYAGYRSYAYGEEFNWNYVAHGAIAGAAVGFAVDTFGTGTGVSATVIGGTFLGAGLGGAAGSVSSGGSHGEFVKGTVKGGLLGGIGAATGVGLSAAGASGAWAFAGSVALDTYVGVGVDAAFGDCASLSGCFSDNLVGSFFGNGLGYGLKGGSKFLKNFRRQEKYSKTPDGDFDDFDSYWEKMNPQARIEEVIFRYGLSKHLSGRQVIYAGSKSGVSGGVDPANHLIIKIYDEGLSLGDKYLVETLVEEIHHSRLMALAPRTRSPAYNADWLTIVEPRAKDYASRYASRLRF